MTTSNVRKLIGRAGVQAKLAFPVHPHMLRHACGHKLANEDHDTRSLQHYLGHKNISHTVRYTELERIGSRDSGATETELSSRATKAMASYSPEPPLLFDTSERSVQRSPQ